MINVQQITSKLRMMPDQQLQNYAMQNKDDPYTVSLALSEANTRKQMRSNQQAKMAGMQQPTVVEQDIAEMAVPQQMPQMPQQAPQQMAQAQLPENVGIGQLPAQNMQRMADGGIVGYADGGTIQSFRSGGSPEEDAFNQAFLRTLKYEGGRTNDTGGDTKYGISKKGNPDVDIDKLTIEGARRLYKERYWDAINGDKLAARDPKLAQVAFDTAVNQSPAKAKEFVTASGGDVSKLMQLRGEHYDNLVQNNPKKYGEFAKGWAARLGNLATDLAIPSAIAGETTSSAPAAPAAAPSPVVTKPVAPAAASAPGTDNRAWYDRGRDLMMSGDAQKAMLHGLEDAPSYLAGAPVDLSYYIANKLGRKPVEGEKPIMGSDWIQQKLEGVGLRVPDSANPDINAIRRGTAGIAGLYNPVGKAESVETAAQAIARRANEATKNERLAGPTTSTTMTQAPGQPPVVTGELKAIHDAEKARAAELTAAAKKESGTATFSPYTTGPQAPQTGRIAATREVAGDLAARTRAADVNPLGVAAAVPAAEQGITALTAPNKGLPMDDLGFDSSGLDALNKADKKEIIDVAKSSLPKGKGSDYGNDFLLMLGLGLMGGQSPNALTNLGQAGIGALKHVQESRKDEADRLYKESLAKHYGVPNEVQMLEYLKDPENMSNYIRQREAMGDPAMMKELVTEYIKNPAGLAYLEQKSPAIYKMIQTQAARALAPNPVSSLPGAGANTRPPV